VGTPILKKSEFVLPACGSVTYRLISAPATRTASPARAQLRMGRSTTGSPAPTR
jgi:hypothetical protein